MRKLVEKTLANLARNVVGDSSTPDWYFVTDNGKVVTVTSDAVVAYQHWKQLSRRRPLTECALENRTIGTIASVEPAENDEDRYVICDDYMMLPEDIRAAIRRL